MKKKLLISFLFLSGLCCSAQAQLQPVKNVPSPEIAGLGEYGKVPVSLFTGIPNISIPLYEVKVGNFSLPISASYHPSSVKANSPSGCLGLGWNLVAGGYITRKVNGILDEKYYTIYKGKVITPGYYSNAYRLKNISTKEFEDLNEHVLNKIDNDFLRFLQMNLHSISAAIRVIFIITKMAAGPLFPIRISKSYLILRRTDLLLLIC